MIPSSRLKKELRLLGAPALGAVVAGPYAAFVVHQGGTIFHHPTYFAALIAQLILIFLIASVVFGAEFGLSTMARLLSQPLSRGKLWREKMGVLALALFLILLADTPLFACFFHDHRLASDLSHQSLLRQLLDSGLGGMLAVVLVAFGTAPLMALYLRQTHTAFWAALVTPVFLGIVALFLDLTFVRPVAGKGSLDALNRVLWPVLGDFGLPLFLSLPYAALTYTLARKRFLNLEV